jgi:ubiquinone/menaquinone biosynthesis C-methylase UbiE
VEYEKRLASAQIDHEYHPDWLNTVALGQYLDHVERQFILSTLTRDPSVHKLVDLSGGSGRIAVPLAQLGYDVTVTDVSIIPLRRLRQKDHSIRAELVDATTPVLPLADGSVDAALCIQVPFYVEDGRNWFFREVHRVVRPGGWLIVTSTNRLSYKGWLRRFLLVLGRMEPQSWHRFEYVSTPVDMETRLNQAGFSVERHLGYNWAPTLRFSDTALLPVYTTIERLVGLDRIPALSPWVITSARRMPLDA